MRIVGGASSLGVLLLSCFLVSGTYALENPGPAPDSSPKDLSGVYECDGGSYTGTVVIQKVGETYSLLWTIGNSMHFGVALWEGSRLCSSWSSGAAPAGIVVYRLDPAGRLVGRYAAYGGDGSVATETLTFIAPLKTGVPQGQQKAEKSV